MSKRSILIIIGLMTTASIGIVALQFSLIRSAVQVKEEKFHQNVYDALNAVAERLEERERYEAMMYVNGYSANYYDRSMRKKGADPIVISSLNVQFGQYTKSPKGGGSLLLGDNDYTASMISTLKYNRDMAEQPIENRVNLEQVNNFVREELADRGIDLSSVEYSYGVYSMPKESFVISDGHYVVEDSGPKGFLPGYTSLYTSDYRVNLFSSGGTPPGMLMIYFPNVAGFVWSSVWANILASILFTGLMLFCFAYTINVIFRQKKLSEMKTDFMNNMTHEFKTPIATISLAADSITSPIIAGNANKVQRFANIIKQENQRMNSQVEKVLQMASLDKEDFNLKLTQIDLHQVINNAVENIGLQVEKREGKAYSELAATRTIVEGDMTHVSNIINNLLDNANKYSPEKPEISVHTRNVSSGVEVTIKDCGIGMTKEARKHIFDKFYRVHTGDLHDVKGFGLGLSYVKAMMTAHKGTIDVKSELGKGSRFILFFPYHVHH